jgi:TP901 family phage tail tape measure protein
MGQDLNIALIINAAGNAARELKKIKGEVKGAAAAASTMRDRFVAAGAALSTAKQAAGSLFRTFRNISIGAIGFGKIAEDYETGIAKISTLTDMDPDEIEKRWGESFKAIARATGEGVNTVTEGAYQALSASVKEKDLVEFMKVATKAAVGGFTDVKTAVDGMSSVMNSWGGSAKQVADIFLNTQNLGKTTFGEVASSIGKVAPMAAKLGVKFEEVSAAIATMTATGSKTPEALTAVRATIVAFAKGTEKQRKALDKLGLTKRFTLDSIATKGYAETLKMLMDKIRATSKTKQEMANKAQAVFGRVEGLNALFALTSEKGLKKYNEAMDQNRKNTNSVNKATAKMMKARSFKKMKVELHLIAIEIGKQLLPLVRNLAKAILPLVKSFVAWTRANPYLVKSILSIVTAMFALRKIFLIIKPLIMIFAVGSPVMLGIAAISLAVLVLTGRFKGMAKVVDSILHPIFKGVLETAKNIVASLQDMYDTLTSIDKLKRAITGEKMQDEIGAATFRIQEKRRRDLIMNKAKREFFTGKVVKAGDKSAVGQEAAKLGYGEGSTNNATNVKANITNNITIQGTNATPQQIQKAASKGSVEGAQSFSKKLAADEKAKKRRGMNR